MATPAVDRRGQKTGAYMLTWRAREVEEAMNQATIAAMNETLDEAVKQAKINAPFKTGALRDDIAKREPTQSAHRITGRWGNWEVRYSIFQEYGTIFISAVHYLRRAADQEYPKLAGRIRRFYTRGH